METKQNLKYKLCAVKKTTIFLCALFSLLAFSTQTFAQDHGHHHHPEYLEISVSPEEDLQMILNLPGVYLDHGTQKDKIFLSINAEGYGQLVNNNIPFQQVEHAPLNIKMLSVDELSLLNYKSTCMPLIDFYPTYEAYEQMMLDFESQFPDICKIIELGVLPSGRKILAAQLGDNLTEQEDEPNFFYNATIHGDELAGYPMMLQLIDHLLCNYDNDARIKNLIDNINIYINPLANPDGTYRGGNQTVEDAIRFNNSFVDINRNFPDPEDGDNPDGRSRQLETQIFIDFAESVDLDMACNIHSGAEVVNYPWDTFSELHADDAWLHQVSREYADTVHENSTSGNYFRDLDNGVTNGFAWYEVQGGRQDYMTYFKRAREITLEVVSRKKLDSDRLPDMWNAHKASLINYLEESLFGLRGRIIDCETGDNIEAEIHIPGHDKKNSSVFSDPQSGTYFRYLSAGIYNVEFVAEGYFSEQRTIDIFDKSSVRMDIELCPIVNVSSEDYSLEDIKMSYKENEIFINGIIKNYNIKYALYNASGQIVTNGPLIDKSISLNGNIPEGLYYLRLENEKSEMTRSIFIY